MKRAGSSKIQGKEVVEEEWPAPGGVVGTAEEGEGSGEVVAGRKIARARVPRSVRRNNAARAARAAALEASEVGSTDNNQGLPGSVEGGQSMKETEAGQSQQDEEDAIWQDARIVALIARHNQSDDEHRAARKELEAELTDANTANTWREREINKHKRTIREQDNSATDLTTRLETAEKDAKDARDAAAADKHRYEIAEGLMTRMRNDIVAINDALKEVTTQKHELETLHDESVIYGRQLEARIDDLEFELKSKEAVATENTTLKEEIDEVHSSFEDVFSDMAKGLTINEKFAYVREHQTTAPAPALAGRPRIVSTSSLHEELDDDHSDDHSDAGSEHNKAATKEPLMFSGISSVETVPDAVPIVAPTATTISAAVKPFTFSGTTSTETVPVAAPVSVVKPFTFSDITSTETVPVAAPVPAIKPLTFSGITVAETIPAAPEVVPIKKPAPVVRVQWRTRTITEHVDRPVVPWWMLLLFLIGMIACASGFAGLLRENQIWLDANDLAYQRLMGAEQETFLASVSMGVQDLLPGMGGMGRSLFG